MTDFSYQLYSSRNFPPMGDTLKMLARLGYGQVEGYGGLFANPVAVAELLSQLAETGLAMKTAHISLDMVQNDPKTVLQIARDFQMEAIFVPHLSAEERPDDGAGWARFGRDLAEIGKPYLDAGLKFGWHNHDFEMADLGGDDRPLDLIMQGSDDLSLELDIAWVEVAGQDAITWISKYSDRLVAAHIKDIAPKGECTDEDGWADVGHGVMDWAAIMGALEQTKAKFFVMEHDNPNDHERFARRAIAAARNFG